MQTINGFQAKEMLERTLLFRHWCRVHILRAALRYTVLISELKERIAMLLSCKSVGRITWRLEVAGSNTYLGAQPHFTNGHHRVRLAYRRIYFATPKRSSGLSLFQDVFLSSYREHRRVGQLRLSDSMVL